MSAVLSAPSFYITVAAALIAVVGSAYQIHSAHLRDQRRVAHVRNEAIFALRHPLEVIFADGNASFVFAFPHPKADDAFPDPAAQEDISELRDAQYSDAAGADTIQAVLSLSAALRDSHFDDRVDVLLSDRCAFDLESFLDALERSRSELNAISGLHGLDPSTPLSRHLAEIGRNYWMCRTDRMRERIAGLESKRGNISSFEPTEGQVRAFASLIRTIAQIATPPARG